MRILSTKTHGYLDYLVGIILMISPWALNFAEGGAETWVPVILGGGAIIYSVLTNYEMGVAKIFSMPIHLGLDIVSGIFLSMSPWLLGFHDHVYLPHLVFGILEIVVATITSPYPGNTQTRAASSKTDTHVPYSTKS